MNRRLFLQQSCFACFAAGAGLSLLSLESCSSAQVITATPENNLIKVDAAGFAQGAKALIIRTKQLEHDILLLKLDQGYRAIYLQCTHQNNPVNYNSGGIVCNAHGSQFDLEGKPKTGPADKRLKRYSTEESQNTITINLQKNEI